MTVLIQTALSSGLGGIGIHVNGSQVGGGAVTMLAPGDLLAIDRIISVNAGDTLQILATGLAGIVLAIGIGAQIVIERVA